jgi:hypothetical protein
MPGLHAWVPVIIAALPVVGTIVVAFINRRKPPPPPPPPTITINNHNHFHLK